MRVLAIDTSWFRGGVAIFVKGSLVSNFVFPEERKHALYLPLYVQKLLNEANLTLKELDLITVSLGPGSFTGLRVGLSFAKALSYAIRKPLKGVGSLEALASISKFRNKRILTLVRLRRNQAVGAIFRGGLPPERLSENLVGDIEVLKREEADQFIDEGIREYPLLLLTGLAHLGCYLYSREGEDNPFKLSPIYIRGGQPS